MIINTYSERGTYAEDVM
jgi:hypothetical protein